MMSTIPTLHDSTTEEQVWTTIKNTGSAINFGTKGTHRLGLTEFSSLLGIPENEFSQEARLIISQANFEYRFLTSDERETLLFDILSTIFDGKLTVSGPEKHAVWDKGWEGNLAEYSVSGDPKVLIPKFVRRGVPKRLNGAFILPSSEDFESDFVSVMRDVLFRKYFSDVKLLHEFGCGTGTNLLAAAEILPALKLHGLDWSVSSTKLVKLLGARKGINIQEHLFDMFAPDQTLPLKASDGVLTIGALEQLGPNFNDFLDFLLQKSPRICIHCETMNELYDRRNIVDFVATEYSKARNYLWGFLTALRNLEAAGKIRIHQTQRVFGSQFHEGYSFVLWSPIINK